MGNVFGMTPEGTRSKTGALIKAKTGVAYLADRAEVPIVPVAITGTELIMHNLRRLRRPHVTVRVGEIIQLPRIQTNERSADLRRHTDEIMCRIAAMLPPGYRGFYADHPRLKALLGETDISQIYSPAD
jgi:1-acyl-sn-glycerol-3-phosphate acyltransferase